MLLSPGHSPRHLSTPSPVPSASSDANLNPNSYDISSSNPDFADRKRRREATVLDEDAYVASIEKIIERDFFPDIPKLRDRLDWLQAIRSRDPVLIRDAQLKILERRRLRKGGDSAADSTLRSATETPGSSFLRNSSITPFYNEHKENFAGDQSNGGGGDGGEGQVDVSLSLDEFFRRYTSEDNESFSKLLDKVNRKRKEKYGYLMEGGCGSAGGNSGNNLIEDGNKREKVNTDGYGTSDQPVMTLEGWNYTAKNLLMYHPADRGEAPLTDEDRALRLKALTKEISRPNTRFHGKAMDADEIRDEDTIAVMYAPVAGGTPVAISSRDGDKMKRYDLEDLRKTPNRFYAESEKKADNGYNFVKTPSPAPGVDESPLITWGEIEGTPLRLEAEDTPIDIGGSGNGPQFKIPMPPSRDLKAHSLSREAAKKLRERSKMFQKPPLHTPVRGGSASPSPRPLSTAAQKFMRNAIAKSSRSIDESLRASYRSGSPGLSTPKGGRSMSRLGRDDSVGSRSPSARRESSDPPW